MNSSIFFRQLVLPALLCALSGLAWGAQPFTLEQVRNYAFPESLVAAANAPRVAWTYDDAGRRNVWVAESPKFEARQLTSYGDDDGQEITSLAFSADGAQLVYVRGGEHGANWDPGLPVNVLSHPAGTKVEVWVVPYSGGMPRLISEGDHPVISPDGRRVVFDKGGALWIASLEGEPQAKQLLTIRGTSGSPAWSPDGAQIAFVSSRESHAFIGVYSDDHTPIRWIAPSTSRDDAPRWSPDGSQIAFVRRPGAGGKPAPMLQFEPNPWELWVADARSGEARPRFVATPVADNSDYDIYFEWGAGGRLVFKSYEDGWPHLYSVAASGEPLKLTVGDYMVEDVALSRDRKHVVYSANTGSDAHDIDRRHVFRVPVDAARPKVLTSGAGLEWSPVLTADDRLVFVSATAQRPPAPATLPAGGGAIQLLHPAGIPADFPVRELVTPRPVTFKSADGLTIHAQLFATGSRGAKRPAVVYLHGGPQRQMVLGWHMMGYYSNDYAVNQYLASRGFVVLAVNYRLGIGYGRDFNFPAASGPRGASEYQDVQAAAHYLQSLPEVDAKRLGVYGGSYGGYLTAMALSRNSDLFVAGVDIHGVHDWITQGDYMSLLRSRRYETAPDLKQALDVVWASSPASDISRWKSPVLFIHGDDDRNVNIDQTVDLVRRLKDTGVHQEELVLVDETHSIQRHANVLRMNSAAVEFLERHLAPR